MKRPFPPNLRFRLDLRTLFGLFDPDLPNWSKVRAVQMRDLRRMLPLVWATNLIASFALASILWRTAPHWQTASWLAALVITIAFAIRAAYRPGVDIAPRGPGMMLGSMLRAATCGALWSIPPIFFANGAPIDQQIAICLVVGAMIASVPVTLTAAPLAMTGLLVPMTVGLMVMVMRTGSNALAALPVLYGLSLLAGGIANARIALRRRWAEIALEEEASLVSLLLHEFEEGSADWLWEIDVRKRLIDVTPRLAQAFGQPADRLRDQPLMGVLAMGVGGQAGHSDELRELLDLLDMRKSFKDLNLPLTVRGEQRWWRLSATPRYDLNGRFAGFRGVGSDITDARLSLERIDRLAFADGLTEIDNRTGFTDKLRACLTRAGRNETPCALMLIDLDRFKAVNDTYGHPVGDKLLREAAGRLAALAGPGDACGRLGGDEFAILIVDASDTRRIDALAARALEALTRPFQIESHLLHVGASIGTAIAPRDGDTVETLTRNADLALYQVKRGGRGAHRLFTPALLDRAERRLAIERGLRDALERGELRLAYQPVTRAIEGDLVGFEALLRWTSPVFGEVSPAEFVPIAEAARLMGPIGEWVLHAACEQATRWPDDVRISINLSAGQIRDAGLPMMIRAALIMSGLSPERLDLEIAESAFTAGGDELVTALDRLRETGARLVLDDFGTGFDAIRQSGFGAIKVAREFLHHARSQQPYGIAMLHSLVAMADTLGADAIAKGAETDGCHALVRQIGCPQIQGHASGQPLSAEAAYTMALPAARRHVA